MLNNKLRELRDLSSASLTGLVPWRIIKCFDDLHEPVFHTLHLASRHTLFRHVSRGSHSRFTPCVWGVRRDDYRWERKDGPCCFAAFLIAAAAMAEFVLRPPVGRWGRLLPGPRMEDVMVRHSKLYLADFWTLTLHHLVWSKRLPYAIKARWAQGSNIHDESFYFISRLPMDLVEASRDALILFQEAARAMAEETTHTRESGTIEPPVYQNGRWRAPVRPEPEPEPEAEEEGDAMELDERDFTVRCGGVLYRFTAREKQLFALLERISRRPGHRVSFDDLRSKNDVWDGSPVEDSTIRGAVTRLRKVLREHGLVRLADCIATGTYQGMGYAMLKAD